MPGTLINHLITHPSLSCSTTRFAIAVMLNKTDEFLTAHALDNEVEPSPDAFLPLNPDTLFDIYALITDMELGTMQDFQQCVKSVHSAKWQIVADFLPRYIAATTVDRRRRVRVSYYKKMQQVA